MRYLKTLALRITKKSYPIAVACLPAKFAEIPFGAVNGRWLVINHITTVKGDEVDRLSVIRNTWMSDFQFARDFKIVNKNVVGQFHEVEVTR